MFQFLTGGPMCHCTRTLSHGRGTRRAIKRVDGHRPIYSGEPFLFAAQFQLLGQRQVALVIIPAQVGQQSAALANHLKQTPAAGLIVLVCAQVLGQLEDAAGQDGHLDFRRTGIGLVAVVIGNDLGFYFLVKRHDVCYSFL